MNIVILNWRDIKHPLAGGAEQSLMEHAKFWKKKGASVTWFSSQFPKSKQHEYIDGIKIVRKGSHYTVHLLAALYFQRHLRMKTDIVIDCFHGMPYFAPLYFYKKKIIALINEPAKEVWFKNMIFPLSLIAYHLEPKFFMPYSNVPFITSASSIAVELRTLGISERHINIIPHGVTVSKISTQKKEKVPTLIFLSQLSPDKGIEDAIIAFGKLKRTIPKAKFWVVGKSISEEYQKKLSDLAKKFDIANDITFFGFVSQAEKFNLLQKAWVLVHPSIREGWGLNVIEANYFGTPAIGYNVTGLKDSIKNGKTGLLTRKNTPEDLAKMTYKMLTNKNDHRKFAENAKNWSSQFTWGKAGATSWKLIKEVYENSKK